jgi:hypothetical protein
MIGLLCFVVAVLASPFKSKIRLEAENAALRHQLAVLRRKLKGRARLTNSDRWFFVQRYRWFPSILSVLLIIRPETLVGWHRTGFRRYWRWKSRRRGGRPPIELSGSRCRCTTVRNLSEFLAAIKSSDTWQSSLDCLRRRSRCPSSSERSLSQESPALLSRRLG